MSPTLSQSIGTNFIRLISTHSALMTTAYPFHDMLVSRAPISYRTGHSLIGMIGCGFAGFSASDLWIAYCDLEVLSPTDLHE
jgi:hypothetical protein